MRKTNEEKQKQVATDKTLHYTWILFRIRQHMLPIQFLVYHHAWSYAKPLKSKQQTTVKIKISKIELTQENPEIHEEFFELKLKTQALDMNKTK